MIWKINTWKVPNEEQGLWADLILLAIKLNCTIEEVIGDMSIIQQIKMQKLSKKKERRLRLKFPFFGL